MHFPSVEPWTAKKIIFEWVQSGSPVCSRRRSRRCWEQLFSISTWQHELLRTFSLLIPPILPCAWSCDVLWCLSCLWTFGDENGESGGIGEGDKLGRPMELIEDPLGCLLRLLKIKDNLKRCKKRFSQIYQMLNELRIFQIQIFSLLK